VCTLLENKVRTVYLGRTELGLLRTCARVPRARARGAREVIHQPSPLYYSIILFQVRVSGEPTSFVRLGIRHPPPASGNCKIYLRHLFSRATPEPGLLRPATCLRLTSSAYHPPRSITCVCFADPSSLCFTEPFLAQKTAFLLKV
jgi:hypothetical protein